MGFHYHDGYVYTRTSINVVISVTLGGKRLPEEVAGEAKLVPSTPCQSAARIIMTIG